MANGKFHYVAVAPDGTVMRRNSNRVYTHMVTTNFADRPGGFGHWCWNGSQALAEKELRRIQAAGFKGLLDAAVVPVTLSK